MISIFTDTADFDIQQSWSLISSSISFLQGHTPGLRCFHFFLSTFSHDRITSTKDLQFLFRIFEKSSARYMALTVNGYGDDFTKPFLHISVSLSKLFNGNSFLHFLLSPCSAVVTTTICFHPNIVLSNCSACVTVFRNNNWMKSTRKSVILTTGGPNVVCDLHTWRYCVTFWAI